MPQDTNLKIILTAFAIITAMWVIGFIIAERIML